MKQAVCPGCGAGLELFSPLTRFVVCEHCGSAIAVRDEVLSVRGKQSGLTPPVSGLHRGFVGELDGKRFLVLGRVRYRYSQGVWDEWYLRFDDGAESWLSEDEGELSLETPANPDVGTPAVACLQLGDFVSFGAWRASVDEKDEAVCVGFEGELPEEHSAGETISYVEGRGPQARVFTLEQDEEGLRGYLGRFVTPAAVKGGPWKT